MSTAMLPDAGDRLRVGTSLANMAVEASAGTGKTYLLVARALWLILVRKVKADSLVALAFGEEAAAELRTRLRAKLGGIVRASSRDDLDPAILAMVPGEALAPLQARAAEALEALDRAHISTIHAFASTLLRLHPAEARVDPAFEVLDETGLDEVIRDEWGLFIAGELGESAPARARWLAVLSRVRLADLAELGAALADYGTDLDALPSSPVVSPESRAWLESLAAVAEEVASGAPEGKKAADALAAFADLVHGALKRGQSAFNDNPEILEAAGATVMKEALPAGASQGMIRRFNEVKFAAKTLRAVRDEGVIYDAVSLLVPFAVRARARLVREGRIPYTGLLALARDLVRDNGAVRASLSRRFDAILLDEAQDVDPMQLELILYLAADPASKAGSWRDLELVPGKLFVVGDPKQSIYGFRGADIRAFAAVVDRMCTQGAERLRPTTSMRSAQEVLDAVNAVGANFFDRYPALLQRPDREPGPGTKPRAEVLAVEPEKGADGEEVEAEAVARRVKSLVDSGLRPRDIAVLFRKRTPMPVFQAALRRAGVPVAIEGERRFFLRTEVMDLVNVVRYLADPADEPALLGVLRGPYVGMDDGAVDAFLTRNRGADPLPGVFPVLRRELGILPPHEWTEQLYRMLGVEAVAAASADPSARSAVRSFRAMLAAALGAHGLARTLELLEEGLRAEADFNPGQGPLRPPPAPPAETDGAVRLLTVHGAKGLEFAAVVLASIDARPQPPRATDTAVLRDWTGGAHGITLRATRSQEAAATLDGCRLKVLRAGSDRDETGRLVYVSLTRARDILVIADRKPASETRLSPGADTFRPFLAPLLQFPNAPVVRVVSPVKTVPAFPVPPGVAGDGAGGVAPLRPGLPADPAVETPSSMGERLRSGDDEGPRLPAGTRRAREWLGELCHEVLRCWDFRADASGLPEALDLAQARIGGRRDLPPALRKQALGLLSGFLSSDTAAMLRDARILGREVPLVAHAEGRTVSARADIIFVSGGVVRIGDYKLSAASLPSAEVARAYALLGASAFGRECRFEVIPLEGG